MLKNETEEAEWMCLDVELRSGLLKFEKLRLYIIMAKICDIKSGNEGALSWWSRAWGAIRIFYLSNGWTTRTILKSICEELDHQDENLVGTRTFAAGEFS